VRVACAAAANLGAAASDADTRRRQTRLHEIGPLTRELLDSGAADGWFFLRYADPDWHLRWRLHGDASALHTVVLPAVQAAAARLRERGMLWRLQVDTYEREVERYGGPQGMRLSERLFQADSKAALDILAALEPGDAGLDERWLLTLPGMGALLEDLGLDRSARRDWVQHALTRYATLVGPGGTYHTWANERYRCILTPKTMACIRHLPSASSWLRYGCPGSATIGVRRKDRGIKAAEVPTHVQEVVVRFVMREPAPQAAARSSRKPIR